jgi:hypothetical protein
MFGEPQVGWPETGGQSHGRRLAFLVSRAYGINEKDGLRISLALTRQAVGHLESADFRDLNEQHF